MPELLYPAYQKFYSALCSLDRFDKESNFFDNVASIDSFFSEYRNVTFAIQSQLKHTEYYGVYERNRDKYLLDHWFVEKRNETVKQQPFRLVKQIAMTIYLPFMGIGVLQKEFSVENDLSLEVLFPEFKRLFKEINQPEICFSTSFSFHEKNNDIDLFDKLFSGISSMQQFLSAMEKDIEEECPLCNQIKENIKKLKLSIFPRDFLLVNDYVYYLENDTFERGDRYALLMEINGEKSLHRIPLKGLLQSEYYNYDGTIFGNFTYMHAILRSIQPGYEIMPAFLIVYKDDTYDLEAFHAGLKTTFYRKINEIAKLIYDNDIKEICYESLYVILPADQNIPSVSRDRLQMSAGDILICASVDCDLHEKEYVFDGIKMEQLEYVRYVMENGMNNILDLSRSNMFPIYYAFKKKAESQL